MWLLTGPKAQFDEGHQLNETSTGREDTGCLESHRAFKLQLFTSPFSFQKSFVPANRPLTGNGYKLAQKLMWHCLQTQSLRSDKKAGGSTEWQPRALSPSYIVVVIRGRLHWDRQHATERP
jgi:hypothetical protein